MARTQGHGNPDWNRDETILALNLYLDCHGDIPQENDSRVIELSALLRNLPYHQGTSKNETFRNHAGVVFKLQNLRQLATGRGLGNTSALDREIWRELGEHPERAKEIAENVRKGVEWIAGLSDREKRSAIDEDEVFTEGEVATRVHKLRERDRSVRKKLLALRRTKGRLSCDVCGCWHNQISSKMEDALYEAHHIVPISQSMGKPIMLRDVALLCANCHRLIHRAIAVQKHWLPIVEARGLFGQGWTKP